MSVVVMVVVMMVVMVVAMMVVMVMVVAVADAHSVLGDSHNSEYRFARAPTPVECSNTPVRLPLNSRRTLAPEQRWSDGCVGAVASVQLGQRVVLL